MLRRSGLAAAAWLVATGLCGQAARAQFGYTYPGGYGGWGGWGASTVEGDVARGMGVFAAGVGQYNVNTAQANSINTDTAMRFNQYLYESQQSINQSYAIRRAADRERIKVSREAIAARLRDNPSAADIDSGDALNVALGQITSPKVYVTTIKEAQVAIPSSLIKDIPFNKASEGVTTTLNDLTDPKNWPEALNNKELQPQREALHQVAQQARDEDDAGDIKPETFQALQTAIKNLRDKVISLYPENSRERRAALPHLKALSGLVRMLEYPETRDLLKNVDETPDRTLADLINFMSTFNLRFGAADTPRERATYRQLFPLMARLRDSVTANEAAAPVATNAAPGHPTSDVTEFFGGMPEEQLQSHPVPSVPTYKPAVPPAQPSTTVPPVPPAPPAPAPPNP